MSRRGVCECGIVSSDSAERGTHEEATRDSKEGDLLVEKCWVGRRGMVVYFDGDDGGAWRIMRSERDGFGVRKFWFNVYHDL